MKGLVRKNVLRVAPYVAGKPIEETKRELGIARVIKLASNENPLGPSPKAKAAMKRSLSCVNRYPDSQSFYLKMKLAGCLDIAPDNIVLGNGSDEVIDIIIKTFVEDDENIITADVTFLEYKIISQVNARKIICVPLKDFKYDLEGISRSVTGKTKLIFISNPNNPTGTYVSATQLRGFLESLPRGVIVALDEAYDAFIDVDDFPNSLNYIDLKNVIILKTFSKAYGLAGLRVGYAVARTELASCMERVRQPFNVNYLAQVAALAALDDKAFLRRTRRVVLEGKGFICGALESMGLSYVPSVANFILFDSGRDGARVFRQLLKYGVIVRDMRQWGLKNFIRVTVGTEEENRKFIRALKKVLARGR